MNHPDGTELQVNWVAPRFLSLAEARQIEAAMKRAAWLALYELDKERVTA
jgi:hypothetical protein